MATDKALVLIQGTPQNIPPTDILSAPTFAGTLGDGTGQTFEQGGYWTSRTGVAFTGGITNYNVLLTDYLIGVTDTTNAGTIQLGPSGSTALKTAWILVKDESYAAATHNITILPPAGKKLDNILNNNTVKIASNGGRWSGYEDGNGNWNTMGIV